MIDRDRPSPRIAQARELFFHEGREPDDWGAPHILRSWRRSRHLDPDAALFDPAPLAPVRLEERREQAVRLLRCARPELESLAEHAADSGCVVILTDAAGLILEEIGSADFLPKAERFALLPGVEWSETHRGTNAIGTALAEREAVMVLGGEHYLPENAALGCAAAPIFNGRGDVVGALDLSGETCHVNPHAFGLVRMAASQVEHRMLLAEADGHLLRFHRRPELLGTAREGLLAVRHGRIVGANRAALAMLGTSWPAVLDGPLEALLGRRWSRLEGHRGLLTLPQGQQIAALLERAGRAAPARRAAPSRSAAPLAGASTPDPTLPLVGRAARVLDAGVSVLVTGETGCGKEVFARRLHAASRRSAGPFVAVNCAALPETLIEAELFGHADGAFTGARRKGAPGRIRQAEGGILFLDEIADMPLALQTRLLRVLEERVVTPLGGTDATVDFDLVCATHADLPALVSAQRFRADLLYRVAGFTVSLPALHERSDRDALIGRLFEDLGGSAKRLALDEAALQRLAAARWHGNVRELSSVLRTVIALADAGDRISVDDIAAAGFAPTSPVDAAPPLAADGEPHSLGELTRRSIERVLEATNHDVAEAARRLGVHRSTVYRHRTRERRKTRGSDPGRGGG